jgi:arsenate reductase
MTLSIYHNPACATSRKVLGLIREAGVEPEIILYLKTPPSLKEIENLLVRMKLPPRAILRRRGTPYDELGLGDEKLSDARLIEAMAAHPILIERPIVVTKTSALLCRPPERVNEILASLGQGETAKPASEKPTTEKPTTKKMAKAEQAKSPKTVRKTS